jgi:hypothetical protein
MFLFGYRSPSNGVAFTVHFDVDIPDLCRAVVVSSGKETGWWNQLHGHGQANPVACQPLLSVYQTIKYVVHKRSS